MIERPIIMSGFSPVTIAAGTKTQTRRIMKPQPTRVARHIDRSLINPETGKVLPVTIPDGWEWKQLFAADDGGHFAQALANHCPYGAPGDRLWVKETHAVELMPHWPAGRQLLVVFRSSCEEDGSFDLVETDGLVHRAKVVRWRPSIYMRREWARIVLEIVDIRAERLQDITEEDSRAEGVDPMFVIDAASFINGKLIDFAKISTHRHGFSYRWRELHGEDSWKANPWVWAITFKRVEKTRPA